jgi:hypothetical protein
MATMVVKNSAGGDETVEKPLAPGRVAAASSRPVTLSSEDKAALDLVNTNLGILDGRVDTLETLIASTNAKLDTTITSLQLIDNMVLQAGTASVGKVKIETNAGVVVDPVPAVGGAIPVVNSFGEYKAASASATTTMGATGALGDYLAQVIITPGTTSPGAVSIKDGSDTAIVIFEGGASSVSNLVPFPVTIGAFSRTGAWQLVLGANVKALGVGNFT